VAVIWNYVASKKTDTPAAEQTTEAAVDETPKIINLTNLDPVDFDSVLKGNLATADTKAKEVNKDYKLADIEIEIGKSLQPEATIIRYVYNLEPASTDNWVISFSQDTGNFIRSLIPSDDYLGRPKHIDTTLWKFNYVTALQLAEKNGGLTYRENNSDFSSVTLSLRHTGVKGWLIWSVVYKSESNSFSVQIDANSGDKVTE